jgi:FKBP-type peptidyl-prolyl cis-trans isomerase 2
MKKITIFTIIISISIIVIATQRQITNGDWVRQWDHVTVLYREILADWRVFNSWKETVIASNNNTAWRENQLIWMKTWDIKTIIVYSWWKYSIFYDPTQIKHIATYTLGQIDEWLKEWDFIQIWWKNYHIQSIKDDLTVIDGNPIHTWQNITYEISIDSILQKKNK